MDFIMYRLYDLEHPPTEGLETSNEDYHWMQLATALLPSNSYSKKSHVQTLLKSLDIPLKIPAGLQWNVELARSLLAMYGAQLSDDVLDVLRAAAGFRKPTRMPEDMSEDRYRNRKDDLGRFAPLQKEMAERGRLTRHNYAKDEFVQSDSDEIEYEEGYKPRNFRRGF